MAVDFNAGSGGHLIQQIIADAPGGVFAAANEAYIDQIDEQGLILPETHALSSSLVLMNRNLRLARSRTDTATLEAPGVAGSRIRFTAAG